MMQLTAATLGFLSLLSPASAEARTRNPSMKQKILEYFEELRRKAGLSKPKDEDVDKKPKDEEIKPKHKNETEENKSKAKNEAEVNKPKLKDDGAEEKQPSAATQKSEIPQKDEPSIPALPYPKRYHCRSNSAMN